jgi:DNA mismatch repair protein MutS2
LPVSVPTTMQVSPGERDDAGLPDLLHPVPRARLDLEAVERAVDFAFASGGAGSSLDEQLEAAAASPSTWDPASFAADIFLDDLVSQCFSPVPAAGSSRARTPEARAIRERADEPRSVRVARRGIRTLLARPPVDRSIIEFRQAILRELDGRPEARAELGRVHDALATLTELLGPSDLAADIRPKQMEILRAVHAAIVAMAESFEGATSALSRVRAFGEALRSRQSFARLASLIDIDDNLAGLDVRLRVGHDGKLRGFAIARIEENARNPLYTSPIRRFFRRIGRWLRGYKFTDSEVLEALVDAVFSGVRRDIARMLGVLGDARFYLAALSFADRARSRRLEVCLPEISTGEAADQRRSFEGLFNPLLLGEASAPAPCDLDFGEGGGIAIFTGPNSGGKTRVLQAIAVAQMLGQAGAFVPARRARLLLTENMFVSLVDHERADQKEGRLGMELIRVRDVFERMTPRAIVMIDELCAGTNPSEGEEIFDLVTSLLAELEPQAFITTHFLDFAARLRGRSDGEALRFFQVQLDESDEPTYRFVPGVAKTSLAAKTAERLGVTRADLEALIAKRRAGDGARRPAISSGGREKPRPARELEARALVSAPEIPASTSRQ